MNQESTTEGTLAALKVWFNGHDTTELEEVEREIADLYKEIEAIQPYTLDDPGGKIQGRVSFLKLQAFTLELRALTLRDRQHHRAPFKPLVVIDQKEGTIEVILDDCSYTENNAAGSLATIYRRNSDGKIIGSRFYFPKDGGFNLQVKE